MALSAALLAATLVTAPLAPDGLRNSDLLARVETVTVPTEDGFARHTFLLDRVLVAFHPNPEAARSRAIAGAGLAVDPSVESEFFARLVVPRGMSVEQALRRLRADPCVRVAEPEYVGGVLWTPNDPRFGEQWGVHNTGQSGGTVDADIDGVEAWDRHRGSPNVVVAVLDTGVVTDHPDLAPNMLRDVAGRVVGYDFYDGGTNVTDPNGHGTHCAGTVGAVGNNGIGVVGVSPSVRLMPVRWIGSGGSGPVSAAISAIDFARVNGAQILSNSWRIDGTSQLMSEAIQRATDAGCLFVVAAGNDGAAPNFPASLSMELANMVSVGATDRNDAKASWSCWDPMRVSLFAPGVSIVSTYRKPESYATLDGTSMACPHVAGAAAVLKSYWPHLTSAQLKGLLLAGADAKPALAGLALRGRLNLNNSIRMAVDAIPPGAPRWRAPSRRTSSTLDVDFVESGDDGLVGRPLYYEVRRSSRPITDGNFAGGQLVGRYLPNGDAGTFHGVRVTRVAPGAPLYLAARAYDEFGLGSPLGETGPYHVLSPRWHDPAEAITPKMTPSAGSTWAVSTAAAYSGTRGYSDSPAGNYLPNSASSMTSEPIVVGFGDYLNFAVKGDTERIYDRITAMVSTDDFATSTDLYSGSGRWGWSVIRVSLGRWVGQTIKVRFQFRSDEWGEYDGVSLDDISISRFSTTAWLVDDVEGADQFESLSTKKWTRTTERSSSPTHCWTDSAGSDYGNSESRTLSPKFTLDMTNHPAGSVSFDFWSSVADTGDTLAVQYQPVGFASYSNLWSESTTTPGWVRRSVDLSDAAGRPVTWRFLFNTSGAGVADGVAIDNIEIGLEFATPVPRATDILLADGSRVMWMLPTSSGVMGPKRRLTALAGGWEYRCSADFSGDGNEDLVVRNTSTNDTGAYSMRRDQVLGYLNLPETPGWLPVAAGDFGADGKPDLIMMNTTSRQVSAWLMDGATPVGWSNIVKLAAGWNVMPPTDLDLDGKLDLVVYNPTSRKVGGWRMNGTTVVAWTNLITLPAGWTPRGFGSFDNTARRDLLVERDADGLLGAYLLNGSVVTGWKSIGAVSEHVMGVAGL